MTTLIQSIGALSLKSSAIVFTAIAACFIVTATVQANQMACAEGMEQESAFLQALDKVTGWQVHGDELKLLDERGGTAAQFVAVDVK